MEIEWRMNGGRLRVLRGAVVAGLILGSGIGWSGARAVIPESSSANGPLPEVVLSEGRAALSAARAAMSREQASDVPFVPSRFPNVRKRSVPREDVGTRLVFVTGLPVPMALPVSPSGLEQRPAETGGVILLPDAAALPLAIATIPVDKGKDSSDEAR